MVDSTCPSDRLPVYGVSHAGKPMYLWPDVGVVPDLQQFGISLSRANMPLLFVVDAQTYARKKKKRS